jgi:hypothetical protein
MNDRIDGFFLPVPGSPTRKTCVFLSPRVRKLGPAESDVDWFVQRRTEFFHTAAILQHFNDDSFKKVMDAHGISISLPNGQTRCIIALLQSKLAQVKQELYGGDPDLLKFMSKYWIDSECVRTHDPSLCILCVAHRRYLADLILGIALPVADIPELIVKYMGV